MDEEIIPIIFFGLAFALLLIKSTSSYIQGQVAGISGPGYDITQSEPKLIIPKSKQLLPPRSGTPMSKVGTQMPYGVVPADATTNSLIDQPAKLNFGGDSPAVLSGGQGRGSGFGPGVGTSKDLGPTSLTNPNTPPDVKTMLANAPPDF